MDNINLVSEVPLERESTNSRIDEHVNCRNYDKDGKYALRQDLKNRYKKNRISEIKEKIDFHYRQIDILESEIDKLMNMPTVHDIINAEGEISSDNKDAISLLLSTIENLNNAFKEEHRTRINGTINQIERTPLPQPQISPNPIAEIVNSERSKIQWMADEYMLMREQLTNKLLEKWNYGDLSTKCKSYSEYINRIEQKYRIREDDIECVMKDTDNLLPDQIKSVVDIMEARVREIDSDPNQKLIIEKHINMLKELLDFRKRRAFKFDNIKNLVNNANRPPLPEDLEVGEFIRRKIMEEDSSIDQNISDDENALNEEIHQDEPPDADDDNILTEEKIYERSVGESIGMLKTVNMSILPSSVANGISSQLENKNDTFLVDFQLKQKNK